MSNKGDGKNELLALVRLVSFFKNLRHQNSLESLGFYFVNNLYNLLPYRQCVLWSIQNKKIKLISASGQVGISKNAPLAQFIKKFIKYSLKKQYVLSPESIAAHVEASGYSQLHEIDLSNQKVFSDAEIKEFTSAHMFQVFLYDADKIIGGIWLSRNDKLGEMENAVLEDIADALAVQMQFLEREKRRGLHLSPIYTSKIRMVLLALFVVFCLWPVRFSVTASAEIVPQNNTVVTAPYDGLVAKVYVEPNAQVKVDDLLFSLDKTQLQNEYDLAMQELRTAQERFSKTERQVFSDSSRKSDIYVLREQIKLKQLEADYAKKRLSLADIKADESGLILFSDKNDLLGRPVRTGDKVMVLATHTQKELLVRIPSDNMIELERDVPIKFFLNTAPLQSHEAIIHNVSYQPGRDADGLLTYKARADIVEPERIEKIGLTGTAKIYGGHTIMIVNLLHRPFIALRNLLRF